MPVPKRWHLVLLALGSALAWAPASVWQARHPPSGILASLAIKLLFLIIWVAPELIYARRVLALSPVEALALVPVRKLRPHLLAGALFLSFLAMVFVLGRLLDGDASPAQAPGAAEVGRTFALAWAEELPLRGFLFLQAARIMKPWRANIWVSLLFAAVHIPVFLARGLHMEIPPLCIALFLLSLMLGWVTQLTRSVWMAALLHTANNLLAVA